MVYIEPKIPHHQLIEQTLSENLYYFLTLNNSQRHISHRNTSVRGIAMTYAHVVDKSLININTVTAEVFLMER